MFGLLTELRKIFSQKNRRGNNILRFRALKFITALFSSRWDENTTSFPTHDSFGHTKRYVLGLVICLAFGLSYAHVESEFAFTRKLETINIIPGNIDGEGWGNSDSLQEQDVSNDALFQSFNVRNSAYLLRADSAPVTNNSESSASDVEVIDAIDLDTEDNSLPEVEQETLETESSDEILETSTEETEQEEAEQTETPVQSNGSTNETGIFGFFSRLPGLSFLVQESLREVNDEVVAEDVVPPNQEEVTEAIV
jgi:hypothetical protein